MSDTPTPRTDANDLGWQFNEQHGDFDSLSDTPMPWLDFAKMLERELTTVTAQRDRLAEALDTITITGSAQYCREIADEALQSITPNAEI
jgi:hypothetical protein